MEQAHLLNDKVCLDALEGLVGLLLQHKDDVTRLNAGLTVAGLTPQDHLGVVLVALLNMHLKDLLLRQKPLEAVQWTFKHAAMVTQALLHVLRCCPACELMMSHVRKACNAAARRVQKLEGLVIGHKPTHSTETDSVSFITPALDDIN